METPSGVEGRELEVLRAGIRQMALRALGNRDVAEEVAQETVVRAFHSIRVSGSRPEKLGAFVAGIARHVIADVIRARPRELRFDDLDTAAEPRTSRDALAALCDASEQARVRDALGGVAKDDRELLHLVFFEGLSPGEIAKRLGVPAERIRQRKLRALARLRVAFDRLAGPTAARHDEPSSTTIEIGTTRVVEPMRSAE